jgi:hypothetical protein
MDPANQRSVHDWQTCAGFPPREPELARVFNGKPEGLRKDDILDDVRLYWLTNAAMSWARLYRDNAHFPTGGFFDPRGIRIPVAVSVLPNKI